MEVLLNFNKELARLATDQVINMVRLIELCTISAQTLSWQCRHCKVVLLKEVITLCFILLGLRISQHSAHSVDISYFLNLLTVWVPSSECGAGNFICCVRSVIPSAEYGSRTIC